MTLSLSHTHHSPTSYFSTRSISWPDWNVLQFSISHSNAPWTLSILLKPSQMTPDVLLIVSSHDHISQCYKQWNAYIALSEGYEWSKLNKVFLQSWCVACIYYIPHESHWYHWICFLLLLITNTITFWNITWSRFCKLSYIVFIYS